MTSPEVIDSLPNQLLDPVAVRSSSTNQILHLLQLRLQLADALVAAPWGPAVLQDLGHAVPDLLQVLLDLLELAVPLDEAGVARLAAWEHARVAAGTAVAVLAGHALAARTRPGLPVALRRVRALRVAVAFWEGGE